jgi:hypothetical protein
MNQAFIQPKPLINNDAESADNATTHHNINQIKHSQDDRKN